MPLLRFLLMVVTCPQVHAVINCPPRNTLIDPDRALINHVAFYDEIKPMDSKAFASQKRISRESVEKQFTGSGVFTCEDAWGNGQVIAKDNMVTTVFHTLIKARDCLTPRSLSRCAFIYKEGSKTVINYAKKVVASGGCKSGEELDSGNDWAIVELKNKLPKSIVPYKVPRAAPLRSGQPIDLVGRTSGFNPNGTAGSLVDLPQSFASCVAITKDTFQFWENYQSNCPTQPGSSGSGVFVPGDTPTFAGLILGGMTGRELCTAQENAGSTDGPFQKNCRGSLIVPVEGKFLSALQAIK